MSRGIKSNQIDFGTGTSNGQVSAEHMPIKDAGGYYGTDNVEAALQSVGHMADVAPSAGAVMIANAGPAWVALGHPGAPTPPVQTYVLTAGASVPAWAGASSSPGAAASVLSTDTNGAVTLTGGIVINEAGGAAASLRAEGDTNTHLLFTDAANDRVGINSSVPAAKCHIDQSSATGGIPVLKLNQAHVSKQCIQCSSDGADRDINLLTVDVTGTPTLAWVESGDAFSWSKSMRIIGTLGVGTLPTTSAGIYIYYLSADTTSTKQGQYTSVSFGAGSGVNMANVVYGGNLDAGTAATYSGNLTAFMAGFQGVVNHYGTGALNWGRGVQGTFYTRAGSGSMTAGACFYAAAPTALGGMIGTAHGLYIEAITAGVTNYAVYSTGSNTPSYHAGRLAVGGTVVSGAQLHVDQGGADAGVPTMILRQADIDVVLMKIIGTAEAASANRTLAAVGDFGTPGALVGWYQVEVQDDGDRIPDGDYYVALYAAPT